MPPIGVTEIGKTTDPRPIDVLVVGGGMYVTGRGTNSCGTILPALLESRRAGEVGRIILATTSANTAASSLDRLLELAGKMAVEVDSAAFPAAGCNSQAYLDAVAAYQPHAVIVAVPDHLHAEIGVPLIERGLHCLMVKPMATSMAEARALTNAARAVGVVAQVEFHKRLDESNILLRDAIRSGRIGTPLYAVIEYSQQKRIPRDIFGAWVARTNVFQYLGVHYVDLLYYVTQYRPLRVTAWGQHGYLKENGLNTWDAIQAVIEWETGRAEKFVSTHITNWIDPDESSAVSDQKINVVGTHGRYQADQKHRGVQQVFDGKGTQDINPYFSTAYGGGDEPLRFSGYGVASVRQFISDVLALRAGECDLASLNAARPSFEAGLISTAVLEAVAQSLNQNSKAVNITYE